MAEDDKYAALRPLGRPTTAARVASGSITVKVTCNDEHRRTSINNGELTFNDLCFLIERLFKGRLQAPLDELALEYKDDEGDYIVLQDDADVAHALCISPVLRVRVSAKRVSGDLSADLGALLAQVEGVAARIRALVQIDDGTPDVAEVKQEEQKEPLKSLTATDLKEFLVNAKSGSSSPAAPAANDTPTAVPLPPPALVTPLNTALGMPGGAQHPQHPPQDSAQRSGPPSAQGVRPAAHVQYGPPAQPMGNSGPVQHGQMPQSLQPPPHLQHAYRPPYGYPNQPPQGYPDPAQQGFRPQQPFGHPYGQSPGPPPQQPMPGGNFQYPAYGAPPHHQQQQQQPTPR